MERHKLTADGARRSGRKDEQMSERKSTRHRINAAISETNKISAKVNGEKRNMHAMLESCWSCCHISVKAQRQ